MKTILKQIAAVAAISSLAAPAFAAPAPVNPAAKLSLQGPVRAATATKKTSKVLPVYTIVLVAALVGMTIAATNLDLGGDDDSDSN